MLRIVLSSVILTMGLAATGLVVWGGWKLGKYLAHIALEEIETSHTHTTDFTTEKHDRKPLWKRQFPPVS